ncbi:hypothetical protein CAK95_15175 [Pseudorhodoplanes sinuspersici]|uniref:Uncharacterized protein n=2 Tax=Pseudorhodoplanes sinuspersici TaxID=1235591 RepID=A0A1W6ZT27_9HYPH|nr:hypothetical protein CAK95_15175 [Pseudorhodoplanes sinuspersici]
MGWHWNGMLSITICHDAVLRRWNPIMTNQSLKSRADVHFKVREFQKADAPVARAEYEAASAATREKTARLRALRLAREAEQPVKVKKKR